MAALRTATLSNFPHGKPRELASLLFDKRFAILTWPFADLGF